MTRFHGPAVALCLCLSFSAVSARGQDGYGGAWTQESTPVRLGGGIESSDAGFAPSEFGHAGLPASRKRRPPTTIYTEHHESGAEIIRRAQAAAEQDDAGFAPFDQSSGEPRLSSNPSANEFDSNEFDSSGFDPNGFAPRGFDPNDSEWGGPPGVPRTATRPDYLDPPRPTPVERNGLQPDQFLMPSTPGSQQPSPWLDVDRIVDPENARLLFTTLPGSGNDLGLTELDVSGTLLFPRAPGLWITPGFGTVFIDGPRRTDLPPQLYNARLEVGYKHDFAPHFGVSLSIAPGIYSDFEQSSSDAWRVLGKAVGFLAFSEQTQAIFGVAYLDRQDVRALPIIGIIHSPNHLWRLEFVFPQPRFAYRILDGDASSTWVYVGGEFGGDTWAIQRTTGRNDVVTYSDWRLKFGIEWKAESGHHVYLETGYVFNRELEYRSRRGDYDPSSTAMLRFGVTY